MHTAVHVMSSMSLHRISSVKHSRLFVQVRLATVLLQTLYDTDTSFVYVHLNVQHGTVEWLPGSPLGNTHETWPDQLLGSIPNVYIYAANNPSESILAKRRGYGTIVSHNVSVNTRLALLVFVQLLVRMSAVWIVMRLHAAHESIQAPPCCKHHSCDSFAVFCCQHQSIACQTHCSCPSHTHNASAFSQHIYRYPRVQSS